MGADKTIVLLALSQDSAQKILDKYSKMRKLNPEIICDVNGLSEGSKGNVDILFYEKGTDPHLLLSTNRNLVSAKMIDPNRNFTVVTGRVKRFLAS